MRPAPMTTAASATGGEPSPITIWSASMTICTGPSLPSRNCLPESDPSPLSQSRVKRIPQPVAEDVEAEDHQHQGKPREDHDVRRHACPGEAVLQHRSPFRSRWCYAESEEGQGGGGHDCGGDQ